MYKNIYKYDDMKRSEHMAVRTSAGWYLWTHQLVEVTGPDAAAFLDRLFTKKISSLKIGRERYTTMLDEKGEIIDDVVIFRRGEEVFWVSTLFATYLLRWMNAQKEGYDMEFRQITSQYHMYAVQGPRSQEMLNLLLAEPVSSLKFFSFADNAVDGIPVIINRAGFTGEKLGYELYCAADQADVMEQKLAEAAKAVGGREVTEFQVMAWTLPTEAGFYYMRDLRHTNPFEVGLEKGIDWEKDFIGKEALAKVKESGPARRMVGFTLEESDFLIESRHLGGPGAAVKVDGEEIGRVAKLVYSYVKETNVGYIMAKAGSVKPGDHVDIHGYDAVICEPYFLS